MSSSVIHLRGKMGMYNYFSVCGDQPSSSRYMTVVVGLVTCEECLKQLTPVEIQA